MTITSYTTKRDLTSATGGLLATLEPQPSGPSLNGASFSPDRRTVVVASSDGPSLIWSTELARPLPEVEKIATARTGT